MGPQASAQSGLMSNSDLATRARPDRYGVIGLLAIFWKQAKAEWGFRLSRGISFRSHKNSAACEAYAQMGAGEFEGINARQQWSNWRTIPKNLAGFSLDHPVCAIDLCCGTGHSTEVLAYFLPAGSSIHGIEYNPAFVEKARRRAYLSAGREAVPVSFSVQSVLDSFTDASGRRIPDASLDLVNSCGAIGFHFDREGVATIARESARVLKKGGLALIDSGPPGKRRREIKQAFEASGFTASRSSRSCLLDPYIQIAFKRS